MAESSDPPGKTMVNVVCNGFAGEFDPVRRVFFYPRRSSLEGDESASVYTPTEFEKYAGMAASKKWKYSVRIDVGAEPDLDWNVHVLGPYTLGRWLEDNGYERSGSRGGKFASHGKARSLAHSGSASASGQMAWPGFRSENQACGEENQRRHSRWLTVPKDAGGAAGEGGGKPWGFGKNVAGGEGHGNLGPRIGPAFQAHVPECLNCTPRDDPDNLAHPEREGVILFESEAAAKESAAGFEKDGSRSLPLGAVYDTEGSSDDENSVLHREKSRRTRKRPKWLRGSVNMFNTDELDEDQSTKHSVRVKLAGQQHDPNDEDTPRSGNRNVYFGKCPNPSVRDKRRRGKRDYYSIAKVEALKDGSLRVVVHGREGESWEGSLGPSGGKDGRPGKRPMQAAAAGPAKPPAEEPVKREVEPVAVSFGQQQQQQVQASMAAGAAQNALAQAQMMMHPGMMHPGVMHPGLPGLPLFNHMAPALQVPFSMNMALLNMANAAAFPQNFKS
ncbi:SAND domain-containing protein [Chloropicon roscoffensis]|uniref:SAND domain-containing protein n=1 Tax=Chloropicon roscoffensis TaxID=1461544 RepID=A0AAX4P7E7_9CHLO